MSVINWLCGFVAEKWYMLLCWAAGWFDDDDSVGDDSAGNKPSSESLFFVIISIWLLFAPLLVCAVGLLLLFIVE